MAGLEPDLSSYGGYGQTNRLLAAAGNSPAALGQTISNAQGMQSLQSGQLNISQEQLALGQKRLGALNDIVSSVMADPSPDNAMTRINDGIRQGVISADDGARELQTIASFGGDTQKIQQYAFQHSQQIANYSQRIGAAYGTPGTISNGQTINPIVTREGPQAGIYRAGGNALQQYMSPGEANAPHTYVDPNTNRTINTTIRGYNQDVGDTAGLSSAMGAPAPSAAPPAGYSGVTNSNSYVDRDRAAKFGVTIVNGRPVYGGAPAPALPGTQPGDVVSPGPIGSSYGSGSRGPTTAGAGAANQAGAPQPIVHGLAGPSPMMTGGIEDYRADLNGSSAKMQGIQPLVTALPLIRQLGQTGSGPGTKTWNDAKSALVSAGIIPAGATDVDVRDEAQKYLNQYIKNSGIAQRSDMGTVVAQQSSPNLETSNKATDALTQNAIAQDRMEAARPLAFKSNDLSGYDQHRATWTQSQDPRAYRLDVMPPDQRTALLNDMSAKRDTPEGKRFFNSLATASLVGVRPPSAPAPGGAVGQ